MAASGIRWTRQPSSRGLASRGSHLEAKTPQSERATPSSTILRGIRVHRACGRTRRISRNRRISLGQILPCPCRTRRSRIPLNCGVSHSRLLLPINTVPPNPETYFGNVQSQNLNFKQGMVQQFNLNIEHQLPGNVVLTAGYAGSRSTHILVDGLNLKLNSPTACTDGLHPGYTLGCGYVTPATEPSEFLQHHQQQRRRPGTLRLSPSQSRNQEFTARALCPAGIHLVANLRLRIARWSRDIPGRDLLAVAGRAKSGLGTLRRSTSIINSRPVFFTICPLEKASNSAATGMA